METFGIIGMVFGVLGFVFGVNALAKVSRLESSFNNAGTTTPNPMSGTAPRSPGSAH